MSAKPYRETDSKGTDFSAFRAHCPSHLDHKADIQQLFALAGERVTYKIFIWVVGLVITLSSLSIGTLFGMNYAIRGDVATKADIAGLRQERTEQLQMLEARLSNQIRAIREDFRDDRKGHK